jgi:hypothetical protein
MCVAFSPRLSRALYRAIIALVAFLVFLRCAGWRHGVRILVPEYIWDGAINLNFF